MDKYDVVVVGAGPAGSTAAKCIAEKGFTVLLVDKDKFPRDKACGGGLPTRVLKRFPYVNDLIDSFSYGSFTHSSSMRYTLKFLRDKPLIANVLRKDFDEGLTKLAVETGAIFFQGKTVTDISIQKENAIIELDGKLKIEAKIILGCDGIRSIVAEKTHLNSKTNDICICVVQEQPMTEKEIEKYFTNKKIVHLFIKTQKIAGYGWIFPKKNHVNIGMGEFESAVNKKKERSNIKELYNDFIKMLKEKKILPKNFTPENLKGGTLPIFPLQKTYADKVMLCGDAAGFVNSITGEGIYYAMASGEIAADVALMALHAGNTTEQFLSQYQRFWMKDFGKDLKLLGRFNKRWGQDSEKIVRLLQNNKLFAKLLIGVTGGRLSISKYKFIFFLSYLFASFKDIFYKK